MGNVVRYISLVVLLAGGVCLLLYRDRIRSVVQARTTEAETMAASGDAGDVDILIVPRISGGDGVVNFAVTQEHVSDRALPPGSHYTLSACRVTVTDAAGRVYWSDEYAFT